jgi:urease accessory protein
VSDGDLQRARGAIRLVLTGSEQGTRIVELFQQSPTRVLFPGNGAAGLEEAVLVNTGGGVAGGDQLESVVTALANASITVTTQAAERIYRALSEPARIATRLTVGAAAKLAWLPQETIVFNGARLHRETQIEVSSGAAVLALEWLVLGRAAHGEEIARGEITDRWRVSRDGRLMWADSFRITDEIFPRLRNRALLADFKTIATLIYFGPDLEERQEQIRDLVASLKCQGAVTVVAGLLVARFAAATAADLRDGLRAVLQRFGPIPKMWSSS